jgi:hypothetical protein
LQALDGVCAVFVGAWPGLGFARHELVRLIADGRDVNDASIFYSGTSSSNQPNGVLPGLSVTQLLTVGTAALAAGDLWNLKAAIPPRFQGQSSFAAPSAFFDRTHRLVGAGATAEAVLMEGRGARYVANRSANGHSTRARRSRPVARCASAATSTPAT